jgi:F0F1-type ATP synthase alpha subunit
LFKSKRGKNAAKVTENDIEDKDQESIGQIISVKDGVALLQVLKIFKLVKWLNLFKRFDGMALNLESEQVVVLFLEMIHHSTR